MKKEHLYQTDRFQKPDWWTEEKEKWMQCPKTSFDCISCDGKCLLVERERHGDPFRRGKQWQTCDDEQRQLGLIDLEPK